MAKLQRREDIFLRVSRDIETVKRCGRRMSMDMFNIQTCEMGDGSTRVGIVVGKRFGNAVRRNRVKRVFRALIREYHRDLVSGRAVVVFPKREAIVRPFEDLKRVWIAALERLRLLRTRSE